MTDRFGSAVKELALSLQNKEEASSAAIEIAVSGVEAYLTSRFGLAASDSSEAASEAMTRFFERCVRGDVDPERAAGLLTVMARNIAVDFLRLSRRETPTGDVELELEHRGGKDDEIAAMLDRRADRAAIVQAMETALRCNDLMTLRISRAWLDMADEYGRAPTAREVAALVGVSHSTVLRALRTFRAYVPSGPAPTKNS